MLNNHQTQDVVKTLPEGARIHMNIVANYEAGYDSAYTVPASAGTVLCLLKDMERGDGKERFEINPTDGPVCSLEVHIILPEDSAHWA